MSTDRTPIDRAAEALDQIRQRADQRVGWPAMSPEKAGALADALNDRRRLVAALTAALDLADECDEVASLAVCNPEWRDAHAMFATTLRAAITDRLRSDRG